MGNSKSEPLVFVKPVLGFAAYSGTGKTTLLVKLLPLMKLQGLRVAMIKQTHHDFESQLYHVFVHDVLSLCVVRCFMKEWRQHNRRIICYLSASLHS